MPLASVQAFWMAGWGAKKATPVPVLIVAVNRGLVIAAAGHTVAETVAAR